MEQDTGHVFSLSAAVVALNNDGKILLIKRADNGQWQIPGGVVEPGETPYDAAIRETREETGITVTRPLLTGCYIDVCRRIIASVFSAAITGGKPTTSGETSQVEYVDVDTALKRVPEVFTYRILDALRFDGTVHFRRHDGERWL